MAVEVWGIPVFPGGEKTLKQIVAPLAGIISELDLFQKRSLEDAEKEAQKAAEAEMNERVARANAKMAQEQAEKLRDLIIV